MDLRYRPRVPTVVWPETILDADADAEEDDASGRSAGHHQLHRLDVLLGAVVDVHDVDMSKGAGSMTLSS